MSTSIAAPSTGAMLPSERFRRRRWPWLFSWALLTLYFLAPPREVFDQSLDKSNYATYAHFFAQGSQWGRDVIPMAGPYGFVLYGHTYAGELFWLRLLGDLGLKAVVAALLLHVFRCAGPGAVRWIWLVGVICLVPTVDDLFHDYAILLAGLCLLAQSGAGDQRWSWRAAALLGFLALIKGTHLLTTGVCLGFLLLLGLVQRRSRDVLTLIGVYFGALLGFWAIARQNPAHLFAYLRNVLDLSSGYNATMGLEETWFIFAAGIAVAVLTALTLLCAWQGTRTARSAVVLLFLATFGFIKWKHGYLRADGHVAIFFTSAAVLSLTALLVGFTPLLGAVSPPLSRTQRAIRTAVFTAAVGLGILGNADFWLWRVAAIFRDVPAQLIRNVEFMRQLAVKRQQLDDELDRVRREADLPKVKNEVGSRSIDFFGIEEGFLLLNRLNYHPRPMGGGSFNVVSSRLQRLNEAFVDDSVRAPQWELLKLQTIDERLPAADDPLTLRAIIDHYSPVLIERNSVLLKRRINGPHPAPSPISTVQIRPGQEIAVPQVPPDQMLLFTFDAPLAFSGHLRSLLYRPPNLSIHLVTDFQPRGRTFVLKPALTHEPVILSPLLLDSSDVLKLFDQTTGNRVKKLRFETEPGFTDAPFTIRFFQAPRPSNPDTDVAELITAQENPVYNREPVALVTAPTGIKELNKEPIVLVHAPGSITWNLAPGDQQVIFSYGIMPQAYLEGNTDGVEFNVEVLWPPSDGRVVFSRMLRPRSVPGDQGLQHARVFLPPFENGAQLRIRTHPGPDNDGAFDQSYITRLQIKSGPLVAGQFSGLGVVPLSGLLPREAVAGIDGRPVYLIHAPGEVVLSRPSAAKRMTGKIGLLPSAYTKGGNTDGVEFEIAMVSPTGARTKFWSRYLDPVNQPGDRGPQVIAVDLPASTADSHIVISTTIGPHGDRSWDQSYLANLKFE